MAGLRRFRKCPVHAATAAPSAAPTSRARLPGWEWPAVRLGTSGSDLDDLVGLRRRHATLTSEKRGGTAPKNHPAAET